MIARTWHAAVAVTVWAGLVVQAVIAVRASGHPPAHLVGTLAGTGVGGRLVRVLSFFTIQSNILVGVTSTQLAMNPRRDGAVWRVLRVDALIGIAVTGIVYATVLARMHEPKGWEQVSTNIAFHYVVPVGAVVGWLLFGPRPRLRGTVVGAALAWPLVWFGYTLLHGRWTHWYPYPFVDVASHGYGRVALNALAVTAVLGGVATVFAVGDRRLPSPAPAP